MKIAISYPPIRSDKGIPLLSQNRQFQWFSDPTYIYPVIPASAATLLTQNGHEIFWDDAIAENLNYSQWLERLKKEKPDIIAIETKTPVIKRHWKIINELKNRSLEIENWKLKIVLMGDHVTALPEESLANSKVDFVLAGGDYDFLLLRLIEKINDPNFPKIVRDDQPRSLEDLPMIDRKLTKWKLYATKNGNFKYTPGSYVMNGRDCWWGACTFCSWTTLFPGEKFRVRSAEKALDEIGNLVELGAKEIMEDSGTLPVGAWLEDFCKGMITRGYDKKVKISCNMRVSAIKDPNTWKLMKKAGFRLILFGIESANQETLDLINKNLRIEEIEPALKMCKSAGLEPHVTFMIGWPWEKKADAQKTVRLAKDLFKKNLIDSLQATIAIPYPGTPLYKYCQENDLLLTDDYSRFDQQEPVMKTDMDQKEFENLIKDIFRASLAPKFLIKKIVATRSLADIRYLFRAARKVAIQMLFRS
jgi:anaerobic magnesium-protoporphyrin IX monomethyl ester cyclase